MKKLIIIASLLSVFSFTCAFAGDTAGQDSSGSQGTVGCSGPFGSC